MPAVEYLVGLSPQQAAGRPANETRDTVVFYATLFREVDGWVYVPRAALETLSATVSAPIYGFHESRIGQGLAAGAVESSVARW
jgi:hypothetical protein